MSTSKLYVVCQHCQKEFLSPIQFPEGASVAQFGNVTSCPHCRRSTSCDRTVRKSQ